MPRNPNGSPAARSLLATLAEAGVSTTPRRLESLWQVGLIPKITGKGPPSPRDVAHVAYVLGELGERKRYPGVAICVRVSGFDVNDETVCRDWTDITGADSLPAPSRYDVEGTDKDDAFADAGALSAVLAESQNPAHIGLRSAVRRGVKVTAADRPTPPYCYAEPVRDQQASAMDSLASMMLGQPAIDPGLMADVAVGQLSPDLAAQLDPAACERAAQVAAAGPAPFVEALHPAEIPALIADARLLLPTVQMACTLLPLLRNERAELVAFGLAAGLPRVLGMSVADLLALPSEEPAPLPSRG